MISKDMYRLLFRIAEEGSVHYDDAPDLLGFANKDHAIAVLQQAGSYIYCGNNRCMVTEKGKAAVEEYESAMRVEDRAERAEDRAERAEARAERAEELAVRADKRAEEANKRAKRSEFRSWASFVLAILSFFMSAYALASDANSKNESSPQSMLQEQQELQQELPPWRF